MSRRKVWLFALVVSMSSMCVGFDATAERAHEGQGYAYAGEPQLGVSTRLVSAGWKRLADYGFEGTYDCTPNGACGDDIATLRHPVIPWSRDRVEIGSTGCDAADAAVRDMIASTPYLAERFQVRPQAAMQVSDWETRFAITAMIIHYGSSSPRATINLVDRAFDKRHAQTLCPHDVCTGAWCADDAPVVTWGACRGFACEHLPLLYPELGDASRQERPTAYPYDWRGHARTDFHRFHRPPASAWFLGAKAAHFGTAPHQIEVYASVIENGLGRVDCFIADAPDDAGLYAALAECLIAIGGYAPLAKEGVHYRLNDGRPPELAPWLFQPGGVNER